MSSHLLANRARRFLNSRDSKSRWRRERLKREGRLLWQRRSPKRPEAAAAPAAACQCGRACNLGVVLANYERLMHKLYNEYELLHSVYSELYTRASRLSILRRLKNYLQIFPKQPQPLPSSCRQTLPILLNRCQQDKRQRLENSAKIRKLQANASNAKHSTSLIHRIFNSFSIVDCRCLDCRNLDNVLEYRVAVLRLLIEYCDLYELYAALYWCESIKSKEADSLVVEFGDKTLKFFRATVLQLEESATFLGGRNRMTDTSLLDCLLD